MILKDISKTNLSIHKTLKENLPLQIDNAKDEIHFTEDGQIYISKNDGTLKSCNTGDIIREVSNPLTIEPLDICNLVSTKHITISQVEGTIIELDKVVTSNMQTNAGRIYLKKNKTYNIRFNIQAKTSANGGSKIAIKDLTNNIVLYNIDLQVVTSISNIVSCSGFDVVIIPESDIEIALVTADTGLIEVGIGSSLLIQEIRNNPVNQYSGFETQVLFDGTASEISGYELADNIDNYDFIMAEKSYNVELSSESVIPAMTSFISPAPYVVTCSGTESLNKEGYRAFDNVAGDGWGEHWYCNTASGAWIQIHVGNDPIKISGFSITNCSSTGGGAYVAPPKTFDFEYSNDGSAFTVAKSVVNMQKLNSLEEIKFELDKPIEAKYFKFTFKEAYMTYMAIGEIKLFGEQRQKKSIVNLVKDEITVDNNNEFYITGNTFYINNLVDKCITKVIGIKGQLPSLLSGGEF